MQIQLLGAFRAVRDDGSPAECGGAKQRGVLAQLALEANRAISLDRLAEGVWGERVPPRYRQNVQTYVSTLRRALEPQRSAGRPSRIIGHGEAYELVAADDEVDVRRFSVGLAAGADALAHGKPRAAARLLRQALDLWHGEPLADLLGQPFAADWLERLQAEHLVAVELEVDARLALADHLGVLAELEQLVAAYPERERFWEQLALAQVRSGRQTEALATLRRARHLLLESLGLDPGPGLALLERQVLTQDPAVLGVRAPVAAAEPVPVPLTRALGRDDVVRRVRLALEDGLRLVVLTGPGGVGKTRLALDVVAGDPGAVWVPFADEPGDVAVGSVVARSLGVPETGLDEALAGRVLVLDNLEHLVAAGRSVSDFLARAPRTVVLATSRGPLRVPGEHAVAVSPLDDASAVALFRERARSVLPSFDAADDVLLELCRHLDALPLAIELAAARVSVLDPATLLRRLPSVADLRSSSGGPARQASVAGAVGWSVGLLDESQERGLRALAALDGAVGVDTAGAAIESLVPDGEPLDLVEVLVNLGLVQAVESASGRRFRLLATVRAVAAPVGDESGTVTTAVADLWLARDAGEDPVRNWSGARLAALSDDLPTLRGITEYLVRAGRADDAVALVLARRRGFDQLGRPDLLDELCTLLLGADVASPWRERLRVVAGSARYITYAEGAMPLLDAVAELDEADRLYRVLGYSFRATERAERDDPAARADAVAAVGAAGDDVALQQIAHGAAGWVALIAGDPDAAAEHATMCLELASEDLQTVIALQDLSRAELHRDGAARAVVLLQEALHLARRLGESKALVGTQAELALALLRTGSEADALVLLGEVLPQVATMGDPGWTLEMVSAAGLAAALAGDERGLAVVDGATARVRALGMGESAVPVELRVLAEALPLGHRDPALPAPELRDLLAVVAELATRRLGGVAPVG